jgi:hypothetical protein
MNRQMGCALALNRVPEMRRSWRAFDLFGIRQKGACRAHLVLRLTH